MFMHNTNPRTKAFAYRLVGAFIHYTLSAIQNYTIKTKGETKNIIYTLAITHTHTYLPTTSVVS